MFTLGDIYIGSFPQTQAFGADALTYSARYGLKGHNGIDIGCPTLTPVLSAADGWISETGFDTAGYGRYIKVVHNGYLTLYAHLNDVAVKLKDRVVAGQLIGHSNNSGFSTGPHLHFAVAPCDSNGIKTEMTNGYSGYIDPNGSRCAWNIQNLRMPIVPGIDNKPPVAVPADDFVRTVAQGSNYKVIASYVLGRGINDFLASIGTPELDLDNNPNDPEGGKKITQYIGHLLEKVQVLESNPTSPEVVLPEEKQKSLMEAIAGVLRNMGVLK